MVTRMPRFIGRRVDLMVAEMDETECGRIIANCKDEEVFWLAPPIQGVDKPEASVGSGAASDADWQASS